MKIDFTNNATLLTELKKGNENSLAYLIDCYHKPLCLYVYSLSNDYDGAKDIVQNVFISIWERKQRLPQIKSFKSYLYKAVYNEFLTQYRKFGRTLSFEKEYFETLNVQVSDENETLLNEQINIVKKEIEKLSPKCRETFLLSKREGLTNMEIAEYLKISTKTVENHITRAFRILRKRIGNQIDQFLFLLFKY